MFISGINNFIYYEQGKRILLLGETHVEAGCDEEKNATDIADYLLLDSRSRPLAIVETKRFSIDSYSAKEQAEEYAKKLQAPFIFLSNGEDIYFWDYDKSDARLVDSFFSRFDLERISTLRKYQKPFSTIPIPEKFFFRGNEITVRPYQKEAFYVLRMVLLFMKKRVTEDIGM